MNKILVIEDEPLVLENTLDLLMIEGFEPIGAENGRLGLRLAREHIPDLILCDIMMPELDGYGVLTAIRQDETIANTPFIFLTAKASKRDYVQGMALGANGYLTKPYTALELLQTITQCLQKQEVQ